MSACRCLLTLRHLVDVCRPDLVFVENVPGLQKLDSDSQPFGGFLSRLEAADYKVDYRPIKLAKYGIPQSRRRLVLVGSRHGTIHLPDEDAWPRNAERAIRYCSGRDLSSSTDSGGGGASGGTKSQSSKSLGAQCGTSQGDTGRWWPPRLAGTFQARVSQRLLWVYRTSTVECPWDSPASGLTTRCTSYSNGRFGHPEQDRAISIREAACLQTYSGGLRYRGVYGVDGKTDWERSSGLIWPNWSVSSSSSI